MLTVDGRQNDGSPFSLYGRPFMALKKSSLIALQPIKFRCKFFSESSIAFANPTTRATGVVPGRNPRS